MLADSYINVHSACVWGEADSPSGPLGGSWTEWSPAAAPLPGWWRPEDLRTGRNPGTLSAAGRLHRKPGYKRC